MRLSLLCAAALIAGTGVAQAQAPSATTAFTGKMAPYSSLIGTTWNCKTTMTGMPAGMPSTANGTVTFDAVDPGTMHVHVAAARFASDSYFGYAATPGIFWSTSADSMGGTSSERSSDGKSYAGAGMMGGAAAQVTDTYNMMSATHTTVHSTMMVSGHQQTSDSDCTKT